jgi:hypothetical protein
LSTTRPDSKAPAQVLVANPCKTRGADISRKLTDDNGCVTIHEQTAGLGSTRNFDQNAACARWSVHPTGQFTAIQEEERGKQTHIKQPAQSKRVGNEKQIKNTHKRGDVHLPRDGHGKQEQKPHRPHHSEKWADGWRCASPRFEFTRAANRAEEKGHEQPVGEEWPTAIRENKQQRVAA